MPAPHAGFVPPEPDPAARMIVQSVVAFVDALAAIGIVVAVLARCIAMSLTMRWDGGHWTTQSLRGLGPQRALRDCNIEEVADHYRMADPTGGMRFHLKEARPNKDVARDYVLNLFGADRHPEPVRILTMPGDRWTFETRLLCDRERGGVKERSNRLRKGLGPARTEFHCVENDRSIYYEALVKVPAIRHPDNVIVDLGRSRFAERSLSYLWIKRYVFADVDDMMEDDDYRYDCVWLDYLGPLSMKRLSVIKNFFAEKVTSTLVLTNLKTRWERDIGNAIEHDYESWLIDQFSDYKIEHYFEYFDTCPMGQLAVSKIGQVA